MQKGRKAAGSLNLKDPEARRLAHAIAQQTGETMTGAVLSALRQRHEQLRRHRTRASEAELLAIARRAAAVRRPYLDHAALLYDEDGLPRRSSTPPR